MAAGGGEVGLGRRLEWPPADAILIVASSSRDPDLAPFVGAAHLGESFLLWPRGADPRLGFLTTMERDEAASTGLSLLDPERLEVRRLLEEHGTGADFLAALLERAFRETELTPGRVAVAGRPAAGDLLEACGQLGGRDWSFLSARETILRYRKVKSGAELEVARKVASATVDAFRAVATLLAGGYGGDGRELRDREGPIDAGRLRAAAARVLAEDGFDQPEGNIVAAGAAAGVPHTRGESSAVLRAGQAIIVDLFPCGRLFADCTRTFCVGEPPAELARAHAEVEAVLRAAGDTAVAGASGWELQEAACARFEAAGYPTPISHPGTTRGYVHGLGHGVGFELHELPSFRKGAAAEGRLEAGDLITLEPGLYDPEAGWGVRLEDLCAVGESGVEILTPLPYGLDPRTWD